MDRNTKETGSRKYTMHAPVRRYVGGRGTAAFTDHESWETTLRTYEGPGGTFYPMYSPKYGTLDRTALRIEGRDSNGNPVVHELPESNRLSPSWANGTAYALAKGDEV